MATLTIKNVPDDLYKELKQSAGRHRRSINSEALICLERSLLKPPKDVNQMLARFDRLRKKTEGVWLTDEVLSQAKREGRL